MALANFFDKSALAASQVLRGVDQAAFATIVERHTVGLMFDDAAVSSPEGIPTLHLCMNLFARLYSRIVILAHGAIAESVEPELVHLAYAINPNIDIAHPSTDISALLVVGTTPSFLPTPTVYIGSDGWLVRLSPDAPVGSGITRNPYGAGAAACFGVANIFRILFGDYLLNGVPDQSFTLSLLDYGTNPETPFNPEIESIDLEEVHLVGLGAIGNAALWALDRTPGLRGTLHIIDHECIELSNLQRYVLTTQQHLGIKKTDLAHDSLQPTALDVQPHASRWGDYLRDRQNWQLKRVAVAVDSAADRRAIQASLPYWIANAWTQAGDLGLSRHTFLGDQACLMCLYLPTEATKNQDQLIAEAIGLPHARDDVRTLLATQQPIPRMLLQDVAAALDIPVEPLLAFEGKSLRTFYTEAICGGLVLNLGGMPGRQHDEAAVPLAFQSALAGVMLAAEIVVHAGNLRSTLIPVTTKIDLLRPLGRYLSQPAAKHISGRCICQDADYIEHYRIKYVDEIK